MDKKDIEKKKEPGYCTADPTLYGLLKQFAKDNRQHETPAEMVLWKFLRESQMGVHFRRQHVIGPFIADFISLPLKLIIEIDGGYHQLPSQIMDDAERTAWLEQKEFRIIRFTNEEVLGNTEETINIIKKYINEQTK